MLDSLSGGFEIDQTFVDSHAETIPGLGTLTTRGFTGGDAKVLGGKTDGALDRDLLCLGALNQLSAN